MKKSLNQISTSSIKMLEKGQMSKILGGSGKNDSSTKKWTTLRDGHPSVEDQSPDPDQGVHKCTLY